MTRTIKAGGLTWQRVDRGLYVAKRRGRRGWRAVTFNNTWYWTEWFPKSKCLGGFYRGSMTGTKLDAMKEAGRVKQPRTR